MAKGYLALPDAGMGMGMMPGQMGQMENGLWVECQGQMPQGNMGMNNMGGMPGQMPQGNMGMNNMGGMQNMNGGMMQNGSMGTFNVHLQSVQSEWPRQDFFPSVANISSGDANCGHKGARGKIYCVLKKNISFI